MLSTCCASVWPKQLEREWQVQTMQASTGSDAIELFSELYVACRISAVSKLCCLLSAAILPGRGIADIGQNYVFMAGFWGWFLAQTCKVTFKSLTKAHTAAGSRCRPIMSPSCRFSQNDGEKESGI